MWVCVLGVSFTPQDPPAPHGCLEAGKPQSWGSSRHRLPAADAAGDTGTGAWPLNGDQLRSLAAPSSSFPSPPAVWCHAKHPGLSGRSTPGCSCRAQSTPAHAGKHPRSWGDIPNDAPQPVCLRNGVVGGRMPPTPLWRWDPVQAAGHGAQPSPATSTVSHGPALAPAGFLRRDSAPALPGGNGSHGVPQNSPWDPSPMWQAGEGGSCIVGGQGGGGNWPCPGEQGAGWERGSWL